MKTNTFLLLITATVFALAGCSAGTTVITEEFDASICLEDPTVEGCDSIVDDDPECDSIWDPDCNDNDTDNTEDDEEDPTSDTTKSFSVLGKQSYSTSLGGTLLMPLEVKGGTGKGPFTWALEGETYGATLQLTPPENRRVMVIWTAPVTGAGTIALTVNVSDAGMPTSKPKNILLKVRLPDEVRLMAFVVYSPLVSQRLDIRIPKINSYSTSTFDMSKGAELTISVARMSSEYAFTSSAKAITVVSTGCDDRFCYARAFRKTPGPDLSNVVFTVRNTSTGERSTLTIDKILMGGSSTIKTENTAALCKDGKDNDGDKKTDCADPDCASMSFCVEGSYASCTDKKDNDGDGKIDCKDPDCKSNPYACWEDKPEDKPRLKEVRVFVRYDDENKTGDITIKFCRNRDLETGCTDEISLKGHSDFNWDSFEGEKLQELKGMDPAQLNYFTINGSMNYITEVRVNYCLDDNALVCNETTWRTAYWNPCVYRNMPTELKFGKNDTAVCLMAHTAPEEIIPGGDTGRNFNMVLEGVEYITDILSDTATGIGSQLYRDTDLPKSATTLQFGPGYQKDLTIYGNRFFDYNPYSKYDINSQRDAFDKKATQPAFSEEVKVYMSAGVSSNFDSWGYDWYAAIVFQPGYIIKHGFNNTRAINTNAIFSIIDDNATELDDATVFRSRTCRLKKNSTQWDEKRFSAINRCHYTIDDKTKDKECRPLFKDKCN